MLSRAIAKNPRWRIYLSGKDIALVKRVLRDTSSKYTHEDTITTIRKCSYYISNRHVRTFTAINRYEHFAGHQLRKTIFDIFCDSGSYNVKDMELIARRVGLVEGKWMGLVGWSKKGLRQANARVLRYVYDHYYDAVAQKLTAETRVRLMDKKFNHIEDIEERKMAIEELEHIFANPDLIAKWAPDFLK
jgi:hypothetical protein